MPKYKGNVPAAEHGGIPGDYKGSRNFNKLAEKGGRNATTNESRRGAGGMAPKPSGGAAMPGNDRPSAPTGASMARVKGAGSSATGKMPTAGSFTPVQNNALANLTGQRVGQAEVNPRGASSRISPQTRTPGVGNPVATNKSQRRGKGAAFYGEWK
jgi:hypothetical protein